MPILNLDDPDVRRIITSAKLVKQPDPIDEYVAAAREVVASIIDVDNDSPVPASVYLRQPSFVRYINGENPNYHPTFAEQMIAGAFAERRRRLQERGISLPKLSVQTAPPPLTDSQQIAFDFIKANPGKYGAAICRACDISEESTFSRHYVPALKLHGVRNRRGYGYYVE